VASSSQTFIKNDEPEEKKISMYHGGKNIQPSMPMESQKTYSSSLMPNNLAGLADAYR
jgi:hypothetical protein